MWNDSPFAQRLGLRYPIVQGPFGGGLSSPELAAAVSNAGGLGSFGAQGMTPTAIRDVGAAIRRLTRSPFAINLWISNEDPGAFEPSRQSYDAALAPLLPYFKEQVDLTPYDLQQRLVGDLRARGIMDGASQRGRFTPFLIPIGGPLRNTAEGRVLLAGDAGGFVNGFSAEGIYYAMVTGDLAAGAILASRRLRQGVGAQEGEAELSPARARRAYVRAWRQEIGAELRDSVLIQRYLFHSPLRMDRVVRVAQRRPVFSETLVDYASGRLSYYAARRRVLWQFPRLLPRLAWLALRGRPAPAPAGSPDPAGV
jgi:hypothetical protein